MNKAELIDAIASGSKLTKADAGRFGSSIDSQSTSPRATLAGVAAFWNLLTEAEQTSWNDVAVNFPAKNKFGDIYTPSGYQVFMKLNSNLALINHDILRSGPIADYPVLPPIEPPSGDPPELLKFSFTGGIPEGMSVLVYACFGVLRGSGFRKGKEKLLMAAPSNSTGVIDCTYAYQNLFGQIKPNSNIYFRFVAVNHSNGQLSVERILRLIKAPDLPVPSVGFYLTAISNTAISASKDWIIPFRIYGFNLTTPLVLNVPVDPAAIFLIGRTLTGPWVNTLNVPLNELRQPRQNVFYLKIAQAAPGLNGTLISAESVGSLIKTLGVGINAIDQFMPDPSVPTAFGNVYSGLNTVLEIPFAYGALRSDITLTLSGANANRFKIGLTANGPWFAHTTVAVRGLGSSSDQKIWLLATPGDPIALTANLNADAGGDLIYPYTVTANAVDGALTSPMFPGAALGNNTIGDPFLIDFQIDGTGVASNVGVFSDSVLNCTVLFSENFNGPWSNVIAFAPSAPNFTAKQIFMQITPIALGAFSFNANANCAGATALVLAYTGVGV